jgi:plasmid stabilization system protein ParE
MPLRVKVSARAAMQTRRAAEWWQHNRPAAPGAVAKDIGESVALLAEQPGIGAKYEGARTPGVRQLGQSTMPGGVSMSTLTIRLPDDKHERLKALAKSNSISINKLMDELATVALANYDARVRFETRAARGNPKRALALLDKLDRAG